MGKYSLQLTDGTVSVVGSPWSVAREHGVFGETSETGGRARRGRTEGSGQADDRGRQAVMLSVISYLLYG
ncbi:MAG: hypothetical protein P8075_12130 [Deltaproteobacteria bacterium]|jgi:hypothetical protein